MDVRHMPSHLGWFFIPLKIHIGVHFISVHTTILNHR